MSLLLALKGRTGGDRARIAVIAVAGVVLGTVVGRLRGYRFGPALIVRCHRGHLFTTVWIPGASIKSLRLGWWRLQRCPVGRHWTLVHPVREQSLGEPERRAAYAVRDIPVP
ncbi:MAG TPA: hypothetical protein VGI87_09930 [Solirubrobacteraceae bacterium]|jgi:hypothetical protein